MLGGEMVEKLCFEVYGYINTIYLKGLHDSHLPE